MKITRSVGLLRFGGVLTLTCVVAGGIDVVLRRGGAGCVEAGAAGVRVEIGIDCGESAEEQAADVGECAGAARGDAATGQKGVEGGEGMIDALGVLEAAGLLSQGDGEVLGVAGRNQEEREDLQGGRN
jgi:hypothetical protein